MGFIDQSSLDKRPIYIASLSFGKDSLATILLALEHNEPLDSAVFAEVMYDHSRNISGEIPEHIEWIYSKAIPKLKSMGVNIDIVRAKTDYIKTFMHVCVKGKAKGYIQGFPLAGRCRINGDCKIAPIHNYYKSFNGAKIIQYVGIAIDEPIRLQRMHKSTNKISLMEKYGITEKMAIEMCREEDLLSPLYSTSKRGGCWFCPNMRKNEACKFRKQHPELWNELLELSKVEHKIGNRFKYDKTIEQINDELNAIDSQLLLFDDWN